MAETRFGGNRDYGGYGWLRVVTCGYGWLELVTEVTGVTYCCGWLQVVGGGKEWIHVVSFGYECL